MLDVYFLFRLPCLLPAPLGDLGQPIDTVDRDMEQELLRANRKGATALHDELSLPAAELQFACSAVEREVHFEDLAESWLHLPHLWPWIDDAVSSEPDSSSSNVEWVSLLSVRITARDALQRFEDDQDAFLTDCFATAVRGVQDLLEVLALVVDGPLPTLSAADLEPIVPFAVRHRQSGTPDPLPVGAFLNLSSADMFRFYEPRTLCQEKLDAALRAATAEAPYLSANSMHRQAMWARATGDYWSSVLKAAVYSEMLLHVTARLLAWERGMSPETGRKVLANEGTGSLASFAAEHVGKHLGGNWDAQSPGPVQFWHQSVVAVRNRLLHTGARSSPDESIAAVEGAGELLDFIKGLLLRDHILAKYPITAYALWGQQKLIEKEQWTKRVRQSIEKAGPDVFLRFRRWSRSLDAPAICAEPETHEVLLTAVFDVDTEDLRWVVRVLNTPWAAEAALEKEIETPIPDIVQGKMALLDEAPREVVIALPGERSWKRTGEWVLAHHLLPNADPAL